jgi:hypothetical protein
MPEKTRQQRRARERSPRRRKKRGGALFLAVIMLVSFGGIAAIWYSRANPPPLTRGAAVGEHWHAKYAIFVCGKRMSNWPTIEGQLHTHSDAFIHIHPHDESGTGDLASLGTWLRTYETSITQDAKGKRELTFPDGTSYKDGDRCPKDKTRYSIEVRNNGKLFAGDPSTLLPHEDDSIEIRFGPKGNKTMPNPYAEAKGLPDPGAGAGETPAPDTAPAPQQPPIQIPPAASPGEPEGSAEPDDAPAE